MATHTTPRPAQLDWADVQYFIAVAETGTPGGAAKRLGVNHSTVLRRIARLEHDLRCRLFDRLPGGYALTANGNALAQHLAGLQDQVETAQRKLTGLDPSLEGTVRVATSDIVVESLLLPLIVELRRMHPSLELQLVTSYRSTALTRREADVAVRGADRAPSGMIAQRVGHIETGLSASQGYLTRAGADRPFAEHRWVALDESLGFPMLHAWMRKHVARERIVLRVDSLVAAADAIAAGIGIGLLPRPLIDTRPALLQLGAPEVRLDKPIWVLMHAEVERSARARAVFELFAGRLAVDRRLAHS